MFIVYIAASLPLFLLFIRALKPRLFPHPHLPPGSLGWPLLGETPEFLRASMDGKPERFIRERMEKHDSKVVKTHMFGEPMIVFCGQGGNKFLFSNENKLVRIWWPAPVRQLLGSCLITAVGDEAKLMRRMLMTFLNPKALANYVERMDTVTQQHIATHWDGKEEVKVYATAKLYTFELACRLLASIDDRAQMSNLAAHFDFFIKGMFDFPINIPGTSFYKAMRSGNAVREELRLIARQRRAALEAKTASAEQDLLSHLLVTADASGRFLTEMEIVDNILLLLFAGHDTSRSVLTMLMKYLGEMPQVFENVMKEQIDIAKSKEPTELLNWKDIEKMKYSWSVASEVLRLTPPVTGAFREAIVDFTYAGYTIPKGWKLHWSMGLTHKDETLFQNPEKFDAMRFQGEAPIPYSYVPFGGGPRMCPGNEFARLQILVFLHNIIKRFKWDILIPDEKFGYDPMLSPHHGLPIRLRPHQVST